MEAATQSRVVCNWHSPHCHRSCAQPLSRRPAARPARLSTSDRVRKRASRHRPAVALAAAAAALILLLQLDANGCSGSTRGQQFPAQSAAFAGLCTGAQRHCRRAPLDRSKRKPTTRHAGGDDWLRPFRDALGGIEGQLGAQLQDEKERSLAAEAQVSKLDAELLAEREARQKQEERTAELEAGLEDLRAQIPKFEERMAELERDLAEAETLVEQLQKNRTSLEAELASEKATSEQLEIKIAALQDMYTSVSDELEGMQGREEQQAQEQTKLQADLAASQESKTRLESLLAERDEELMAAQARLTTIKGSLGAAATALVNKFKKPSEALPP